METATMFSSEGMTSQEIQKSRNDPVLPVDVGGWLQFLCLMLTVTYPGTSLYQIFWHTVPNLISARTPKGLLLLSVRLVVLVGLAVFSFVAGLRLWLVKPDAVKFARLYLWTYLTAHFAYFVFLDSYCSAPRTRRFGGDGVV
jgi:hypothetical protein